MRYLIYHEEHGVYLGGNYWSISNPGEANCAPTFDRDDRATKMLTKPPEGFELSLYECHPDMPGFKCSMNAVADAGLPRWGEDGAPARVAGKKTETPAPKKVGSGKNRFLDTTMSPPDPNFHKKHAERAEVEEDDEEPTDDDLTEIEKPKKKKKKSKS